MKNIETVLSSVGLHLPTILLPNKDVDLHKFSVIACDQFSAKEQYWQEVESIVGDAASALRITLPEVYLHSDPDRRIENINSTMRQYLSDNVLTEIGRCFVYLRRLTTSGIRHGLIAAIDLEQYDYTKGSQSLIRATEDTVVDRLPPRIKIRRNAPIELPHIMVLIDDKQNELIKYLESRMADLKCLYDFPLMCSGGHSTGYCVVSEKDFLEIADILQSLKTQGGDNFLFAMGDGNHSLAAAKSCWEEIKDSLSLEEQKTHPSRFALVEIVSLHDPALRFEPIHRLIKTDHPQMLLKALEKSCCCEGGYPLTWYLEDTHGTLYLDPRKAVMAVTILQPFLDNYLRENGGDIDYIHGDNTLRELAHRKDAMGLLLPPVEKGCFFQSILSNGVLPRKTFSMGHAQEKRYYLETRSLRF